jgi:prophage regulatory protein
MTNNLFLRIRDVIKMTGRSKTRLYADIKESRFPKPVKIGPKAVAWSQDEVIEWQKACIYKRDSAPAPGK